jgi:predicted dehydrogenase
MKDGMNYAPQGKPKPVVHPGEFNFASVALDHGHINGQTNGLIEAGGTLTAVYDPDPVKVAAYVKQYPQAKVAASLEEVLDDPTLHLINAAAVPCERGPLGCRVMQAGKDYFTDKTPFTSLDQLAEARRVVQETGRKYMVYFSERLHVECAVQAGYLIAAGAIGEVVQVLGLGPHRLNAESRPGWFFERAKYGGILCDIGSHQCEQFLFYSGATSAQVLSATVGNMANPEYPELEDFGEAHLLGNNGATNFMRVDWLTPTASRTWGDGRMMILGTKGYLECRKYIEVGRHGEGEGGDQLYLVNGEVEERIACAGKVGFPFFGEFILDVLNRTERAMTQAHAFMAAELCLQAQSQARRLPRG